MEVPLAIEPTVASYLQLEFTLSSALPAPSAAKVPFKCTSELSLIFNTPWGKESQKRVGRIVGEGGRGWLQVAGESHWVMTIERTGLSPACRQSPASGEGEQEHGCSLEVFYKLCMALCPWPWSLPPNSSGAARGQGCCSPQLSARSAWLLVLGQASSPPGAPLLQLLHRQGSPSACPANGNVTAAGSCAPLLLGPALSLLTLCPAFSACLLLCDCACSALSSTPLLSHHLTPDPCF